MRRSYGFGLIISAVLAFAATCTEAKSPVNGPYYPIPSWDQTLPASTRFIVLSNMNSNAVLDQETGLVWEQSPSDYSQFGLDDASLHCLQLNKGGRKGWRVPTIQELSSLIDSTQSNPALPSGHPFTNVQPSNYLSANANASACDTCGYWGVNFFSGDVPDVGGGGFAWCVRGGSDFRFFQ